MAAERTTNQGYIKVRGARTHNLKSVNLDVPYRRITAFCGLSGSGKSSLALDVLYAEGQRRYVECFSPYVRQRLEQMEKPEVDSIEGIPPAVAVTAQTASPRSSATVGDATETNDFLRLLYAKLGTPYCGVCGKRIRRESPQSVEEALRALPEGAKIMIAFAPSAEYALLDWASFRKHWLELGVFRVVADGKTYDLNDPNTPLEDEFDVVQFLYRAMADPSEEDSMEDLGLRSSDGPDDELAEMTTRSRVLMLDPDGDERPLMRYLRKRDSIVQRRATPPLFFIVDRAIAGKTNSARVVDSLESAFALGEGRCWVFVDGERSLADVGAQDPERGVAKGAPIDVDGVPYTVFGFSRSMGCEDCGTDFPELEPNLFNFSSPKGACPVCLGLGQWTAFDMDRVFPNKNLSIDEGAIAPWNNKTYRDKLREFINYAGKLGVRTNAPFSRLTRKELLAVLNGSPKLGYRGLNGFFASLLSQKYKMHIRVFLARWQTTCVCPVCKGARLRKEALDVKIEGKSIHDLSAMPIEEVAAVVDSWKLDDNQATIAKYALRQTKARLAYLMKVGLPYLTLERPMNALSSGEYRRVKLTGALGSDLVDMLYVLDEPSNGLHPHDSLKLRESIGDLRDRGNTVIVVDHDKTLLESADNIVELGPGAGALGGQVVYEGTVEGLKAKRDSITGSYLSGRRVGGMVPTRRFLSNGFIELVGATGRNLKNVHGVFPLQCLCVVTGVSGAGKSSLVQETLYPALCSKLGGDDAAVANGLPYEQILGSNELDEVALVDQTPIGRSPRSNPVTYLKIFDDIRNLYAETPDAKANGFNAGYFSFNVDGGRCNECKGEGYILTEMQFSADVFTRCPQCDGKRYQRPVLDILYRGRNIADVLNMTAREAFAFFRGQPKIQQKLKRMMDVGLDYLQLGQPANTLSGGEAQRLKLASFLSNAKKGPCMYIMDEPTSGLHYADVVKLLDCFNELVASGNSVVVVEHNLLVMKAADYIIDMGPGAADKGGTIVAEGTPEEVCQIKESVTARYIAQALAQR